jgi:putative ABC transport system permease protein
LNASEGNTVNTISVVLLSSASDTLVYVLVAIGVFLTLRVLAFPDLTVDGSFVTGGSITALMISKGHDPYLSTLAAFFGGLCCGFITALLNTKLRITALLAGIIMMVGLYSINLTIMGRPNIPLIRSTTIFDSVAQLLALKKSGLLVIGILAVITAIFVVLLNWFLRTEIGLALRATGDNEQMIRSLGSCAEINILIGCGISNALVGLSGALVAQRQGFCDVNMGIGIIVIGVACVIIGEAVIEPRSVALMLLSALAGTFIYRLFIVIALRMGLPPEYLKLITAALVILALGVPVFNKIVRREWMPPAPRF